MDWTNDKYKTNESELFCNAKNSGNIESIYFCLSRKYLFYLKSDYRTLDLDDANGPRNQTFTNETSLPLTNIVSVFSAIHGMEYYNTDGTVNEINVNT